MSSKKEQRELIQACEHTYDLKKASRDENWMPEDEWLKINDK